VTPEGYEYLDVAEDVGVSAWGRDLPACLRQCALGVFNLIVPTDAVQLIESREVAARGDTLEALFVSWLNECLYVHDLEGFAVGDVARPEVTPTGVHGVLRGEPVDPARHRPGTAVKGATRRGLVISETRDRVSVRLVLDI
jgi:SHS2 domain-containing protein